MDFADNYMNIGNEEDKNSILQNQVNEVVYRMNSTSKDDYISLEDAKKLLTFKT